MTEINPVVTELKAIVADIESPNPPTVYANRRTLPITSPDLGAHIVARYVQDRLAAVVSKNGTKSE